MDYTINPSELTSTVPVPSSAVDRYLRLAKAEHIKVLLYIFRKMTVEDVAVISDATGVSEYDVKEALLYWADTGILLPLNKPETVKKEETKTVVARTEKPTRNDAVKRGMEDPKIAFLLREAQMKLARNLKTNETTTLVWIYDDLGLDVSVILYIIELSIAQNSANIRFIESLAVEWVNKGISNIAEAEEENKKRAQIGTCWNIVCAAFGFERRKPSKKEEETAYKWLCEWQLPKELLVEAYEENVNTKSKFSFAYTAKIIENWYNAGIKTVKDLEESKIKPEKANGAAYDLDLYEKMLNTKD